MVRKVLVANGMDAIGEAACMRLALLGYRVAVAYVPGDDAVHAWLADMERRGYRLQAYACDGADHASAMRCLARLENETGPVDIFVNNGGNPDIDRKDRNAKNDIDRKTVRALADAICDGMTARGWGRIINILPIDTEVHAGGQADSPAADSGMPGLSNAQLPELAKKGVTINTISPRHAGADTGGASSNTEEMRDDANPPQIPVGRLSMAEEVAGLIAYLASDEAAFVTGAHIAINGPQQSP